MNAAYRHDLIDWLAGFNNLPEGFDILLEGTMWAPRYHLRAAMLMLEAKPNPPHPIPYLALAHN